MNTKNNFTRYNHPGLLITIEGIDGSGKTVFGQTLAKLLQQKDQQVLLTREPGGSLVGEMIREIVKNHEIEDPIVQALLFTASRRIIVNETIKPALQKGKIVIIDRFVDSMMVYQKAQGVSDKILNQLYQIGVSGLQPDLIILINTDPVLAQQRISTRPVLDKFDIANLKELNLLAELFQKRYKENLHHNWILIDGSKTIQHNASMVLEQLKIILPNNKSIT